MEYVNVDVTLADLLREAVAIERGNLALARRRCCSCGRIVTLANMAAATPMWWRVNYLRFMVPELTYRQIGILTGLEPYQVRDYAKRVLIPDDAYAALPSPDELWKKCNM